MHDLKGIIKCTIKKNCTCKKEDVPLNNNCFHTKMDMYRFSDLDKQKGKKKSSGIVNGLREKQENSTRSQFGSIVYN